MYYFLPILPLLSDPIAYLNLLSPQRGINGKATIPMTVKEYFFTRTLLRRNLQINIQSPFSLHIKSSPELIVLHMRSLSFSSEQILETNKKGLAD